MLIMIGGKRESAPRIEHRYQGYIWMQGEKKDYRYLEILQMNITRQAMKKKKRMRIAEERERFSKISTAA